jgi:hypothetical protein
MRAFFGQIRRWTRFALASMLWLHTLFVVRLPSPNLSRLAFKLQMSTTETLIFVLLFLFSLLATYGFGRLIVDVLYLYFFPFVLLWITAKWIYCGLVAIHRFCTADASVQLSELIPNVKVIQANQKVQTAPEERVRFDWAEVGRVLIRPFRRFTLLWCFLLLLTSHQLLLEIALAIVAVHVAFILITILRVTLFSASVISTLETRITDSTNTLLAAIASVTPETEATTDLRNVWAKLVGMKAGLLLLQNKQLVSRWAAVLGSAFLACIYLYVAFLFSFIYYGAARIQAIPLTWPLSFVTSLFLPFAFTDLPRNFWIKLAGGIHCTVIVAVSAGTVISYVTRKAQAIQQAAVVLSQRFSESEVQSRLLILEEKFKVQTPPVPVTTGK